MVADNCWVAPTFKVAVAVLVVKPSTFIESTKPGFGPSGSFITSFLGLIVYSQTERSQIKNKEKAIKILKTRLYDRKLREKEEKEGAERRSKIGTGDRSEKIRTYNFPQNRLTDHRINFTLMQLDRVMLGKLDEVIEALILEDQKRKLENNVL